MNWVKSRCSLEYQYGNLTLFRLAEVTDSYLTDPTIKTVSIMRQGRFRKIPNKNFRGVTMDVMDIYPVIKYSEIKYAERLAVIKEEEGKEESPIHDGVKDTEALSPVDTVSPVDGGEITKSHPSTLSSSGKVENNAANRVDHRKNISAAFLPAKPLRRKHSYEPIDPEDHFGYDSKPSATKQQRKSSIYEVLDLASHVSARETSMESRKASMESRNTLMESRNTLLESRKASMVSSKASIESKNASMESRNGSLESRNGSMESRNGSMESKNGSVHTSTALNSMESPVIKALDLGTPHFRTQSLLTVSCKPSSGTGLVRDTTVIPHRVLQDELTKSLDNGEKIKSKVFPSKENISNVSSPSTSKSGESFRSHLSVRSHQTRLSRKKRYGITLFITRNTHCAEHLTRYSLAQLRR